MGFLNLFKLTTKMFQTVETENLEGETPVRQTWQGAVIKDRSLWVKWKFGSGPNSPELRLVAGGCH